MIQRVQSVYLLLITILMSFLLVRPYAELVLRDGSPLVFNSLSIKKYTSSDDYEKYRKTLPLFLLVIITGALSFVNIFFFQKRLLQIRLCMIGFILLMIILIIMIIYYISTRYVLDHSLHAFRLAVIFPIMAIIMNFMAYRAIHHDEMLVNSYNRIR